MSYEVWYQGVYLFDVPVEELYQVRSTFFCFTDDAKRIVVLL